TLLENLRSADCSTGGVLFIYYALTLQVKLRTRISLLDARPRVTKSMVASRETGGLDGHKTCAWWRNRSGVLSVFYSLLHHRARNILERGRERSVGSFHLAARSAREDERRGRFEKEPGGHALRVQKRTDHLVASDRETQGSQRGEAERRTEHLCR